MSKTGRRLLSWDVIGNKSQKFILRNNGGTAYRKTYQGEVRGKGSPV